MYALSSSLGFRLAWPGGIHVYHHSTDFLSAKLSAYSGLRNMIPESHKYEHVPESEIWEKEIW